MRFAGLPQIADLLSGEGAEKRLLQFADEEYKECPLDDNGYCSDPCARNDVAICVYAAKKSEEGEMMEEERGGDLGVVGLLFGPMFGIIMIFSIIAVHIVKKISVHKELERFFADKWRPFWATHGWNVSVDRYHKLQAIKMEMSSQQMMQIMQMQMQQQQMPGQMQQPQTMFPGQQQVYTSGVGPAAVDTATSNDMYPGNEYATAPNEYGTENPPSSGNPMFGTNMNDYKNVD